MQKKRNRMSGKWKKSIKKRDNFQCQCCGKKIENLQIHHIFPFAKQQGLGKNKGNVISLCPDCHKHYHKKYKGKEDAVTFAKYMRDYGRIVKK